MCWMGIKLWPKYYHALPSAICATIFWLKPFTEWCISKDKQGGGGAGQEPRTQTCTEPNSRQSPKTHTRSNLIVSNPSLPLIVVGPGGSPFKLDPLPSPSFAQGSINDWLTPMCVQVVPCGPVPHVCAGGSMWSSPPSEAFPIPPYTFPSDWHLLKWAPQRTILQPVCSQIFLLFRSAVFMYLVFCIEIATFLLKERDHPMLMITYSCY